jgi:hypothetical protein
MIPLAINWTSIGYDFLYAGCAFLVFCIVYFGQKHIREGIKEVKQKNKLKK